MLGAPPKLEDFADVDIPPHPFEVELRTLVMENHRLTIEAIAKAEQERTCEIREELAELEPEIVQSSVSSEQVLFDELRSAAHQLALVALVTRPQCRIGQMARFERKKNGSKAKAANLVDDIAYLDECAGRQAGRGFFKELVAARDSVIHGDSKKTWKHDRNGEQRTIADRYACGDMLNFQEVDLQEAFDKATDLVVLYDLKLQSYDKVCARGYGD